MQSLRLLSCSVIVALIACNPPMRSTSEQVPKLAVPSDDGGVHAWTLHFSPEGGCEEMVVALIDGAKKKVRVQAYGFTSLPVAEALVRKQKAGVDVQGVFDRSDVSAKTSKIAPLKEANAGVFIDSKHPIMHVKAIIVDDEWVEFGSFNFTGQAKHNAEDCYEERSPEKAALFTQQWELHKAHSEAF